MNVGASISPDLLGLRRVDYLLINVCLLKIFKKMRLLGLFVAFNLLFLLIDHDDYTISFTQTFHKERKN